MIDALTGDAYLNVLKNSRLPVPLLEEGSADPGLRRTRKPARPVSSLLRHLSKP